MPRRLEKTLVDDAALSRRAARRAIAEGRVRVVEEGARIDADVERLVFPGDRVELDGAVVEARRRHLAALFHKPAGVVATLRDPDGRPDLSSVVAALPPGCHPVGRLDRATTGALLFTTDGDLAHAVRKPWHRVPKHYLLDVAGDVGRHDPRLENLVRGVDTALGTLHVERVTVVERPPQSGRTGITRLRAVLVGGKNRQLRRMCYRSGLRLLHLHRDRFGPVHLGALMPGDWRPLTGDQVDALWASVGGRDHIRQRQLQALARRAALARERGAPLPRLEHWLAHPSVTIAPPQSGQQRPGDGRAAR